MRIPILAGALVALALTGGRDMPPRVASLVEAERAFAKMSVDVSMRDAFLTYLAEDAVLFNPGPVDGRALHESRAPSRVLLAWEPCYVEVSAAGDFGLSTGPWRFSAHPDSAPAAFGHFVSIWKKQADGAWKVVLDLGIRHARVETPPLEFHALDGSESWPLDDRAREDARAALLATEAAFARDFARSAADALRAHGASDLRRYRDGAPPARGMADVVAAAGTGGGSVMHVTGSDLASSGDLGTTTGYRGEPAQAYFVRVWRRDHARTWKLVLDIESAVPAPRD